MVHVMGTAVVFCTTYALILPAITMEQETICGLEAHDAINCYSTDGALICTEPVVLNHVHADTCLVPTDQLEDVLVCQKAVEVSKVWSDGNENHTSGSVIVRLYADGKDTGRYVTLNAANDWKDRFVDLPYFQEDGTTVVKYTVVEDYIPGYVTEYSDGTVLEGIPVEQWTAVSGFSGNESFRIISGSYALAVDEDGNVISALNDSADTAQCPSWLGQSANGRKHQSL